MTSFTVTVNKPVILHPNPQDINNRLVTPGVENFTYDTGKMTLEYNVGGNPNNIKLTPLAPAVGTIILISGQNSNQPGEPTITEQVSVDIVGPLHHFAPTIEEIP